RRTTAVSMKMRRVRFSEVQSESKRTTTCAASSHSVLRVAGPADLESLYSFEVSCFQEHPFRRDHVAWILGNNHALTLVQDGVAGFAAVMMLLFEGQTCRVLSVGVNPQARRRGIATRMMATAEAISRERGVSTIRLEVSTRNFGHRAVPRARVSHGRRVVRVLLLGRGRVQY